MIRKEIARVSKVIEWNPVLRTKKALRKRSLELLTITNDHDPNRIFHLLYKLTRKTFYSERETGPDYGQRRPEAKLLHLNLMLQTD
jgi:hypothetical protein